MPEKVLITGGSGLIGTRLTELLLAKGWSVVHLGRREKTGKVRTYRWDPYTSYVDAAAFDGVTKIVHLAGASIAGKRWTTKYKAEILNSRVRTAQLLFQHLSVDKGNVNKLVSASAIGYYGSGSATEIFREDHSAGTGFLADVVKRWEVEVNRLSSLGIQVVIVRTGIVLSDRGGALKQMALPIKLGVGAPLGSGEQMISWIHIDDLCSAYIFLLENDLIGPFNATAPQPVNNAMLTKAIARQLRRPLWLPNVPGFALRLILGELADAALTGSNVSSRKISDAGFEFAFRDVQSALKDLY